MFDQDFDNQTNIEKVKTLLVEGLFLSRSNFRDLEISIHQLDQRVFEIWFDTRADEIVRVNDMAREPYSHYIKHLRISTPN